MSVPCVALIGPGRLLHGGLFGPVPLFRPRDVIYPPLGTNRDQNVERIVLTDRLQMRVKPLELGRKSDDEYKYWYLKNGY